MRRIGHFEEMEAFVSYLKNTAEADPDRLQPVYGIDGERELTETELDHLAGYRGEKPVRIGNAAYAQEQHDVYGEMIAAIAPLYLDVRFEDHTRSLPLVARLLARIEATLESPDAGLWELRADPRVHTFSLLMHWVGAEVAGRIAEASRDRNLSKRASSLSQRARKLMEDRCFNAQRGYYVDAVDGENADAALLMMINLGFLPKGHAQAEAHLRGLAKELFVREPLLRRYKHFDGIGETHSAFTVCGFWYIEALARLGHLTEAERGFEELLLHANHVGLFSEDIDPKTGEAVGQLSPNLFPCRFDQRGLRHLTPAQRGRGPLAARRSFVNPNGAPLPHVGADVDAVPPRRDGRVRPHEHDAGVDGREVHAAMAARDPENVMPVGAVNRVSGREILNPGHVPELESRGAATSRDAVFGVAALLDVDQPPLVQAGEFLAVLLCLQQAISGGRGPRGRAWSRCWLACLPRRSSSPGNPSRRRRVCFAAETCPGELQGCSWGRQGDHDRSRSASRTKGACLRRAREFVDASEMSIHLSPFSANSATLGVSRRCRCRRLEARRSCLVSSGRTGDQP